MIMPGLSVLGLYIVFIVFLLLMILIVAAYLGTSPYPIIVRHDSETEFRTCSGCSADDSAAPPAPSDAPTDSEDLQPSQAAPTGKFPFAKLEVDDPVDLSVIVPAYNEEQRLGDMLDEALGYLERRRGRQPQFEYELIVVDDGSRDATSQTALRYTDKHGAHRVRLLKLAHNRGKGGAVRMGMLSSRGRRLLFADADGATRFGDIDKLESALTASLTGRRPDGAVIVCGSRAHLERESIAQRSLARTLLMKGFHWVVWLFTVRSVRDTQCGFKLLTRPAMLLCFANLHVERWAFDAELLYIAERMGIPIAEVAVKWTEIAGSKLTPVISWIEMGFDLFAIWLRYSMGIWRLRDRLDVKKLD